VLPGVSRVRVCWDKAREFKKKCRRGPWWERVTTGWWEGAGVVGAVGANREWLLLPVPPPRSRLPRRSVSKAQPGSNRTAAETGHCVLCVLLRTDHASSWNVGFNWSGILVGARIPKTRPGSRRPRQVFDAITETGGGGRKG